MDKYDYIEGIIQDLKGTTGINYQKKLGEIFSVYYESIEKTFEMPDYYGGDQKNDGWVVEDALFYQVFAPTRLKNSFKKEIQDKFKNDLSTLLKIVYDEGKWNGKVKEFIFIVNTIDGDLPNDSERYFKKTVKDLEEKYNIIFKYSVANNSYIRKILYGIKDKKILEQISSILRVTPIIDENAITETVIIDLIREISSNINNNYITSDKNENYERVSSLKKISINNLEDKRDEIENIISKLDVVEKAVKEVNQDILFEDKFERVKKLIVNKYDTLSNEYEGAELYNLLINKIIEYIKDKRMYEIPTKFLVVYIFDKCDIFERE